MADKLKVAQVGVGNFGGYRRQRMRQSGLYDLVACFDFNKDFMERARIEDGAAPAASFEALLETPGIEALIISTGGKYHAEQALAAMDKGLHVFIEKPLCSTAEEMQALLKKQRETGLVVGVGHNDHRHDGTALTIKGLLDSGALGTLTAFEATTAHSGGHMIKPGDWRGDATKNPGGMLFQCGCHKLHELAFYFGPVKRISAMMRYDVLKTTQTADAAVCTLEFHSGMIGTLSAYHVTPYRHTLSIFGTKMNIYERNQYGTEGLTLQTQSTHLDGKAEPLEPLAIAFPSDDCGNVKSFYQAIREGTTVYPSLVDGARAVAAVFAAEESAKSGRTVDVADVG